MVLLLHELLVGLCSSLLFPGFNSISRNAQELGVDLSLYVLFGWCVLLWSLDSVKQKQVTLRI